MLHLYAGPKEGFTLKEAVKKEGGEAALLIEVDKLRGAKQDMLQEQPYAAMMRMAMDGALDGVIMGPNCRTRSVLRHYPMSHEEHGPRPLRRWGGEEFGRADLNEAEKKKVLEDDILLWRGLFLYIVSVHVRRSLEEKKKEAMLAVEQPATPEYVPETVSLWKTEEWLRMEKAYGLGTQTFNQGDWKGELGGGVVKPTTVGGSLRLDVPQERNPEAKGRSAGKEDSKKLIEVGARPYEGHGKVNEQAPASREDADGLFVGTTCAEWAYTFPPRMCCVPTSRSEVCTA